MTVEEIGEAAQSGKPGGLAISGLGCGASDGKAESGRRGGLAQFGCLSCEEATFCKLDFCGTCSNMSGGIESIEP